MGRFVSSLSSRRCAAAGSLVAACLVASTLAGCGKKGPLEPPPLSPQQAQTSKTGEAAQARVLDDKVPSGLIQPPDTVYQQSAIAQLNSSVRNPARPINAAPRDQPSTFALDPLVK